MSAPQPPKCIPVAPLFGSKKNYKETKYLGALSDIKRATLEELKILKLLKIGPRDTDQAVPVKLTRKCSHIASMMLIEGRIIRGELK